MDTSTYLFAILTICLVGVTFHAWRLDNEKRDFSFFAIPRQYPHRALFWGILGVIVLRAVMVGLGATLVGQFSWVPYLFGAFLIFTGIKMWIFADHLPDIANNPLLKLLKLLKRHMRVTNGLRGNAVWVIVGKIPAVISLIVTFSLIAGGVIVSLWKTRAQPAAGAAA